MKRSPRPRTAELSKSLHQQLNMYALAASAAGVGMLALAQPSEARIVYTPAHQVIHKNSYFGIDLNHDGIVDFTIFNSARTFGSVTRNSIIAWPNQQQTNGVAGVASETYFLFELALKQGKRIGYGQHFYAKGIMVAQCVHGTHQSGPPCSYRPYHTLGKWINVKNRYLGLSFTIHGKSHYGWARLSVQVSKHPFKLTALLTGFAYETIPGKAIIAGATKEPDDTEPTASVNAPTPKPATLGVLALGAPGLSIWRREETAVGRHESN
jgi:hypothetical protein